jgi:hypothetical protein
VREKCLTPPTLLERRFIANHYPADANIRSEKDLSAGRLMSDNWLNRHPWLAAFAALVCGLGNGYEAVYVRPNSLMAIVDGAFAVGSFIAFLGLLFSALSQHFYKSEE